MAGGLRRHHERGDGRGGALGALHPGGGRAGSHRRRRRLPGCGRRGRVIGYTSGSNSEHGPGAELGTIYVDPDWWGEGVGTALFDELRARLRQRGFERVRAVVLAENEAGLPFYRRHGFEQVDEHEEVVGDESHRALVVAREL